MPLRLKLLVLFSFIGFGHLLSQELPPVVTYAPNVYGADNQNWSISQSSDKYIYVANNRGLLEFNGEIWRLYISPNETIMRSVLVVEDLIYTGCFMEFGYWKKSSNGTLQYTSLSENLNLIEDEQFWKIIELDGFILFQSLDRIYIYDVTAKTFRILETDKKITKMYKVNDGIYFQSQYDGVYKIVNGEAQLVSLKPELINDIIVNIYHWNDDLLFHTQNSGFYIFSDNNLKSWPEDFSSRNFLSNFSVYHSVRLSNDNFVLGTISAGLIVLDKNGELEFSINQEQGLNNNTVLTAFEDSTNNLWLGLDNGINCINLNSPFRVFRDDLGKLGTVYCSVVFQDRLYLGTNQGLYSKSIYKQEDYQFVKQTKGQVWSLNILDNKLFCGHNFGTFVINNNEATRVSDIEGTWDIKKFPNQDNYLIQGTYSGFYILKKENDEWKMSHKIVGFDRSAKYFEFSSSHELLVNHEYKGVYILTISQDYKSIVENQEVENITKAANSSLFKYKDEIYYAYKNGVFKYNSSKKIFEKDDILSTMYAPNDYVSGKMIFIEQSNELWSFTTNEIIYVTPGKLTNTSEINRLQFPSRLRKTATGYENVSKIAEDQYLFGTTTGYFILEKQNAQQNNYEVALTRIQVNQLDSIRSSIHLFEKPLLNNKMNNVQFEFSVPNYQEYEITYYQYRLDGLNEKWSNWSTESKASFKNLLHGDYRLRVRAKVGENLLPNEISYDFRIEKPWYLKPLAIAFYVVGILLSIILVHNLYRSYYKKQRHKILQAKEKELELKELENKQQLMTFENKSLQQDVENKGRELGISTMNLIKKNELLNSLKTELSQVKNITELKSVINTINKNLNTTDDWRLFEEAFNNADKEFLKLIKEKHPELTANDLRLCAYLRLNLSSKEIAPLLNISHKSVEVKRYRLRKKMNLTHEMGLTDYILDI